MSYELLKTQLLPPAEAGALLPRERLTRLAGQITQHRVSLLLASAGFGKTSLMCQWYQHLKENDQASAWLSIDPLGVSPVDLLAYLGLALAEVLPAAAPALEAAVESRRYQNAEALLSTLINQLLDSRKQVVVFIDDLHFLPDDSIAQLARLIELAPPELHLVLASRTLTELGLAAVRAQGQLLKITIDDLRFTTEEIQAYIKNSGWTDTDTNTTKLLENRTDGWITGIKLASLAFQSEEFNQQSLRNFSGSHQDVSDFFAEQVIARQEEEVKRFLLKTSPLDRLCADLCDHALQIDKSRAILDKIETSGLFLIGLDRNREWYRYHPLFRDFLTRQLQDANYHNEKGILLRAADWFIERNKREEAIELLLRAGEAAKAAQILEHCSQDWTYKGRIRLVMKYIERIPRETLDNYPTILLTWVWHLIRHLQFEQGRALLAQVKQLIESGSSQGKISDTSYTELRHQLLHREMTLAAAQDDTPLVEEKCQELLGFAEDSLHPYLLGSVYSQLLYAHGDRFYMNDIEALAAKARGVLNRSGYDFALIAVLSVIGTSFYALGKAEAAHQAIDEGIDVARRYGGERSSLVALAELPLSAILYESNDIQRAEDILSRQLANATDWGLTDQFIAGYVTRIRISSLKGHDEEAQRVLDEGMALALDRNLERLRLALIAERLHLMSIGSSSSRNKISQYALSVGLPAEADAVTANSNSRGKDEYRATAWFRLAMARGEFQQAISVAKGWRRLCEVRGARLSYARWGILLSQAQYLAGDQRAAQRTIREAIGVAATLELCRSFLDEGATIHTLIVNCCQSGAGSNHPTDLYALKLLEAFGSKLPETTLDEQTIPYSQLGDREVEVLLQVSLGMRNREVAERLGMTEGSIKWYMQQIFDKLGTRSRFQAVERARKLGLIS